LRSRDRRGYQLFRELLAGNRLRRREKRAPQREDDHENPYGFRSTHIHSNRKGVL
jgi:hypothetical protein